MIYCYTYAEGVCRKLRRAAVHFSLRNSVLLDILALTADKDDHHFLYEIAC